MTFRDKLNWMVAELEVSNTKLSETCKIDGGYISRIRSGKRIPLKNGQTVQKITDGLYTLILEKNMKDFYMRFLPTGETLKEKVYRNFNDELETKEEKTKRLREERKERKKALAALKA